MPVRKVSLSEKLSMFDEHWTPKLIGEINDADIKIAKIQGEFVWHQHENTDELFFVVKGKMMIKFHDGDVTLRAGEMIIVPAGVEHLPVATEECHIMMIERKGTLNTGNVEDNALTVENLESL